MADIIQISITTRYKLIEWYFTILYHVIFFEIIVQNERKEGRQQDKRDREQE
jgi:hypothetical protein